MINLRILTDTVSVKMEPAQPMSCSVSPVVKLSNAEIDSASVSTINANFELSPEDISLVLYIFINVFLPTPYPVLL